MSDISEKSNTSKKSTEQNEKKRYPSTAFPKNTLKVALKIAQSIEDNNAGQPYNKLDLAQSLNYSPESGSFRALITASSRYGLTHGSYKAEKISLTDLGRSIVAPRTDEERNAGLLKSLENIDLFKKFFDRFDQAKMPRDDLLKNTLMRDFGIPKEDANACLEIIKKNLNDWNLLTDIKGNVWLRLDKLSTELIFEENEEEQIEETEETEKTDNGSDMSTPLKHEERNNTCPTFLPHVFISHSKNSIILDEIKTILEFGQFRFTVAEEVETASIPIPEKIFGLMKQCNSAIINVSADEKERNDDGTYRVNPNVLIEIGGAFLAYDKKVILLTDKRVVLPSNLQGLYRCDYEGEELSFSASLKLQKALAQFRETIR
jgi:hypothetical protein